MGFVPDEWLTVTDFQILKKSNIFLADKMRCIQLFHPEFNMINKFAGKELMHNAKSAKVLAPNQYGSRKHHKAIFACLNKVLFNNMLRINKNVGAMGCNDAKG